jgi:Uma2 family endonuclease
MSSSARARALATLDTLLAVPEGRRFHEVIAGELTHKAVPTGEHGATQAALTGTLFGPFALKPGGRAPGGWWFETDVEVEFGPHDVYRPDAIGWRRERSPERPMRSAVRLCPDWVCEILSPSTARDAQVTKFETYRRCGVRHYWIADPILRTLRVHRCTDAGYLVVLSAQAGQRVRAEPFEAIEIEVGALFGDAPTDDG